MKKEKAQTADDLPPYRCKIHGAVEAIVRMRPSGYLHRRCKACFEPHRRKYMRKYMPGWKRRQRAKVRAEILAAYGGCCHCCGETIEGFLSIDHLKNDGRAHRKELGGYGSAIYAWLKKQGFPKEGFALACFNCNLGRAFNGGVCPHESTASG